MSSYTCSYAECVTKKTSKDKEEPFIPFRLLVCGHSVCDVCILQVCKQKKEFIKCKVCSFNTTFTEAVQRNVIQNEAEIKRWLDLTPVTAPIVLKFDANLFPLDFYQIGNGVYSGQLTAEKTAEMIDLDLDDEAPPVNQTSTTPSIISSLFEDDSIIKNVVSRIPRTAPEKFRESVENGIKTYIDLSQNHTSIKRSSDETNEWFKKLRITAKEMFHKMHSILQNREKELMEEINGTQENRLQELRVFMNEILSTRSELKGKLLQSPQLQTDKDRTALKKSIDRIVKDTNIMAIQTPQKEFKFHYENSVETHLKKFGKIERLVIPTVPEAEQQVNGTAQEVLNKSSEMLTVSSDEEEEEDIEITDELKEHQKIDKEVVTILQIASPSKFYVQKASDRERFDILNEEIHNICGSPYYHSPAWDTLKPGDYAFAYSLLKRCWCRATLTFTRTEVIANSREPIYLADIVLIDYGISETVHWYNIREKKIQLFDSKKWPPFAYKCCLHAIKPNRKSGQNWNQSAIDMFNRYVTNNQLVLIDFGTKEGHKFVDLIHYDVPDVTYQIPSVIEVMSKSEEVILTDNIHFSSYCPYKCQPLRYPIPESPKMLKTVSVLVSHVESPDLFYIQLQRQHQSLLNLIDEINQFYTNENAGVYTYYCPKVNTPCAALFDGDNKFYRALIQQKGRNPTEVVVHFVDFGNKQTVQNKNLRLLKDSFINDLPMQAIPCGLIHVDPAFGFKWNDNATQGFKYAIANDRGPQILTMCVYETKQFDQNMPKLLVVLRSYDGDNGIKINELMVKQKLATSTGLHSQPDYDRHLMSSSQESINSMSSDSSVRSKTVLPFKISAFLVLRDLVERFQSSQSDKRSSLIKVIVSNDDNPSEFYVQIDRPEVRDYFETQEKELHKTYSMQRFSGDIQFQNKELCAFQINSSWRRGEVIKRIEQLSGAAPEEPRYQVIDLDYGSEKEVKVSLMRRLSDNFAKDGAFALRCKLHSLRPTGGEKWSASAIDSFNDFVKIHGKDLFILIKGSVETEPISVILYSRQTIVPGAFIQQKTVYESINSIFIEKGLATYDRSEGLINANESDDDKEINSEAPRELKTPMPFSMYSSNESILRSLQQRLTNDTNPYKIGQHFKYLKEVYPNEQSFYGLPTDLETHPTEYNISFRYWFDNAILQPTQLIEQKIQSVLSEKGELEPFVGPYTTGAACTAYFDFDKTWNRAEIIGVTKTDDQNTKMCVRFVDYGNQESMLVDKLSSEVFGRDTAKLALKCQLINIRPVNEEANKEIKNLIYTRILDNKCRFFWENYPKMPMKVTLEIPEGEEFVPFVEFLESRNLLSNRFEDNESVEDIIHMNPIVDEIYGLYPNVFQVNRFYEVEMSYYVGANYAFFQATELRNPLGQEVTINSEHDGFLSMLEELRDDIDSFPLIRNYREGYQCVAKYEDECWYRGLVVSVDQFKKTAQVFFIDHGNTDPIAFQNLREIPNKYLKPRAHAFLCQIHNIKPLKDQTWSRCTELAEMLMKRLTDISTEEKMFARFKNSKYPLKIDLYRCQPNDQTVPGKHVFQDFVEKGLLEFSDPRDVWRKPIETTQSYKSYKSYQNLNVKTEK